MHALRKKRKENRGVAFDIVEHHNNRYGEAVHLITISNVEFIQPWVLD